MAPPSAVSPGPQDPVAARADGDVFHVRARDERLVLGGLAAILMQLADPRIARGTAAHSGFTKAPLERLRRTLDFVYAVGFGSEDLARFAAREVNARHRPVVDPAGSYSAFDPDAQWWVAATLAVTGIAVHERLRGPLTPAAADVLVRGYGRLGAALQAGRAGWPETRATLDAAVAERLARLTVTAQAQSLCAELCSGRGLPRPLRPLLPPVLHLTASLLPPPMQDQYGLFCYLSAERWWRLVRCAGVLPDRLLSWPLRSSLARVEQRRRAG